MRERNRIYNSIAGYNSSGEVIDDYNDKHLGHNDHIDDDDDDDDDADALVALKR